MIRFTNTLFRLAALLLISGAVSAAPALADTLSTTLTVYDPSGQAAYVLRATEGPAAAAPQLLFLAVPSLANGAMEDRYTMVCDQPGCTASGSNLSYLVGVFPVASGDKTSYYLGFVPYEPGGGRFEATPISYVINTPGGAPFDATKYLAPDKQAEGWTAAFIIDPLLPAVPEPGTLLLLGSSIAGIATTVRRRRM